MKSRAKKLEDAKSKSQVCILVMGMHRSGTSALTRVMNLHGVELGEDLLPSADDNEQGFWENRAVVELQERLPTNPGRSWHAEIPLIASHNTTVIEKLCNVIVRLEHGEVAEIVRAGS